MYIPSTKHARSSGGHTRALTKQYYTTTMHLFATMQSTEGPAADHPGYGWKGYGVLRDVVGLS